MKFKMVCVLTVFVFFVSCRGSGYTSNNTCYVPKQNQEQNNKDTPGSTVEDIRCVKIDYIAITRGKALGYCYNGPLRRGGVDPDPRAVHPHPAKCKALLEDAKKECEALPRDNKSMVTLSGSSMYHEGVFVMANGEPVKNARVVIKKGRPTLNGKELKPCMPEKVPLLRNVLDPPQKVTTFL